MSFLCEDRTKMPGVTCHMGSEWFRLEEHNDDPTSDSYVIISGTSRVFLNGFFFSWRRHLSSLSVRNFRIRDSLSLLMDHVHRNSNHF